MARKNVAKTKTRSSASKGKSIKKNTNVSVNRKRKANAKSNINRNSKLDLNQNQNQDQDINENFENEFVKNYKVRSTKGSKKEPRSKRKKKSTFKFLIVIFLFTLLIVGVYLLLKHQAFNIVSFNLEGTNKYTVQEIIDKINLKQGKNIFIEIFSVKKENIIEFPYIDSIDLDVDLPNVININVVERVPKYFAYDKEKNSYFKLDENGYVLEESNISNKRKEELLMYGITFDDEVILGEKINEIDMSKILVFLEIKDAFEKNIANKNVTKVNFENSLTTITVNDKLDVIFPNNDSLNYKIALLSEILKSIGEDAGGVVDLTKINPTYSSF